MFQFRRTFGLAVALSLGVIGQALGHAQLKSAKPPIGGTVPAAPAELELEFTEGVDLAFTGVEVLGPDQKPVTTAKAAIRAGGDRALIVPLSRALAAGTYTVAWHVLSTDGHKTHGTYTFTVQP
jgi:methionine-rich copper-binding protein CopC